jgi:hypothetical protein
VVLPTTTEQGSCQGAAEPPKTKTTLAGLQQSEHPAPTCCAMQCSKQEHVASFSMCQQPNQSNKGLPCQQRRQSVIATASMLQEQRVASCMWIRKVK